MRDREAGFTLIETVVALAMLALALGAAYQAMSGGWHGLQSVRGESVALDIAKSRLAAAGVTAPLTPGETSGEADGGYLWSMTVAAITSDNIQQQALALAGYWVTVDVRWRPLPVGPRRSVSLTTVKLVERTP